MLVNPVTETAQIDPPTDLTVPRDSLVSDQKQVDAVAPIDEFTLSPAATALRAQEAALIDAENGLTPEAAGQKAEEQVLTVDTNGLSPAAAELKTETKLAAAAAAAGHNFSAHVTSSPAALWKSALADISE